jgi:hypothetical protein
MDQATFEGLLEWVVPVIIISVVSHWVVDRIVNMGRS